MQLYIEGHTHRHGYAVSRSWSDAECSQLPVVIESELRPVRFFAGYGRAQRFVARWNRLFATPQQ